MPDWLTYAQAGERLGISAEAARRHARRRGWRTQPGNDGRALVLLPEDETVRTRPPGHTPAQSGQRPPGQPDGEVLAEVRRRAEAAEARVRELLEELAGQRERAARAEGEATATREALDREQTRADLAEAEARNARQKASEARQEATEAVGQAAGLEAEVEQTRTALAGLEDQLQGAEEDRTRLRAERDAIRDELADWTAGGPIARAWRAMLFRRGRP